jgi:hypothetical protein
MRPASLGRNTFVPLVRIAAPRLAPTYRQTEDTGRIAECVRVIREETKQQTEILGLIEREQAIENRAHHERKP